MRGLGLLCALSLVFGTSLALANHKNAVCYPPEEIFDEIASSVPANLTLLKLDRSDALQFIDLLFKFSGGGEPPFDLSKVTGGVVIFSPKYPKAYAGLNDGPNGEICHATVIPVGLARAILAEIAKGKS